MIVVGVIAFIVLFVLAYLIGSIPFGLVVGKLFYEMGDGQWDHPHLRTLLEEVLPRNKLVKDYIVDGHFPKLGVRKFCLNASRFFEEGKGIPLILLAIDEVKEGR